MRVHLVVNEHGRAKQLCTRRSNERDRKLATARPLLEVAERDWQQNRRAADMPTHGSATLREWE